MEIRLVFFEVQARLATNGEGVRTREDARGRERTREDAGGRGYKEGKVQIELAQVEERVTPGKGRVGVRTGRKDQMAM